MPTLLGGANESCEKHDKITHTIQRYSQEAVRHIRQTASCAHLVRIWCAYSAHRMRTKNEIPQIKKYNLYLRKTQIVSAILITDILQLKYITHFRNITHLTIGIHDIHLIKSSCICTTRQLARYNEIGALIC